MQEWPTETSGNGDSTVSWTSVKSMALLSNFGTKNRSMLRCLQLALEACKSPARVLITGEDGCGKSLLAKSIHYSSPLSEQPCVTLSCSRVGKNNLEAELFGISYDYGETSFQDGALGQAAGGTIIIDEVEHLPISIQTLLLKALEEKRYRLVGSGKVRPLNARFISISSSDLSEKAASGLFLEELIYCLGEVTLRLPPLRARQEDIPSLVEKGIRAANLRYGKRVAGLSKTAMDFLKNQQFPDNIRELNQLLNHAVSAATRDTIYVEDLGVIIGSPESDGHHHADSTVLPLAEMERRHIALALARVGGNQRAAARILHVPQSFLKRKIRIYGLDRAKRDKPAEG